MNKKTILVVAILILLSMLVVVVFFWDGEEPRELREFAAISDLARVEIMPPAASDGPELIVLERRGADQWWMTRPMEEPIWWRLGEELEIIFRRPIGTDDLVIESDRAESYGLSEDEAVRLALFEAGAERPTREFLVGRQIQVIQTGAERTFVKVPGGEVIYRAQRGFGDLVRLSVDDWLEPEDAVGVEPRPLQELEETEELEELEELEEPELLEDPDELEEPPLTEEQE